MASSFKGKKNNWIVILEKPIKIILTTVTDVSAVGHCWRRIDIDDKEALLHSFSSFY